MSKFIAVANQKGGVGKTTCAINIGLYFASKGKKVLFLDFDSQNDLGDSLDNEACKAPDYLNGKSFANGINMFKADITPEPIVINENVHLIGADKGMVNISQDNIFHAADSLDRIKNNYDYIFIDCPPSADMLQHAALLLSQKLLIISEPDPLAIKGVDELIQTARKTKRLNPDLEVAGIILNSVAGQSNNLQKDSINALRKEYGELVLTNEIKRTVRVKEALKEGKALFQTNPKTAQEFGFIATSEEVYERLTAEVNA